MMTEFEDIERWGKPQPSVQMSEGNTEKKKRLPVVLYSFLVLLGVSILTFSLYYAFVRDSGSEIDAAGQPDTTLSSPENTTDPVTNVPAQKQAGTSEDADPSLEVTVLDLELLSGKGDPNNSGTATLEINAMTGEVCYELNTESFPGPSRSHIHVGTSDITGGDIILELDNQEKYPAKDCVRRDTRDIDAILSDLPGHYIELHSPKNDQGEETQSVRATR